MNDRPKSGQKMQPVFPDLGIFRIDFDTFEKRIHRNAQGRHLAHGGGEILLFQAPARSRLFACVKRRKQSFFGRVG